jgi:lysophospholipase L1-like esterase
MRSLVTLIVIALVALVGCAHHPLASPAMPTLFLVGDSTMANQPESKYPEQGWGQALPAFLREGIELQNHATNGRSTKSFRDEGRWQVVLDQLNAGDFVIIGFGHNDQKIEDPARYAEAATDYRRNLARYIDEAQAKGAQVVLLTSIPRRSFDAQGQLQETLGDYPAVARQVAADKHIPLVDLNHLLAEVVQSIGEEASKHLYMHATHQQYPNLPPEGKQDNTHTQVAGAERVARLFVGEVKRQDLPLARWLR